MTVNILTNPMGNCQYTGSTKNSLSTFLSSKSIFNPLKYSSKLTGTAIIIPSTS